MNAKHSVLFLLFLLVCDGVVFGEPTEQQLARWLERFPNADANGDGKGKEAQATLVRESRLSRVNPSSPFNPSGRGLAFRGRTGHRI